jgi:hypothetical protein
MASFGTLNEAAPPLRTTLPSSVEPSFRTTEPVGLAAVPAVTATANVTGLHAETVALAEDTFTTAGALAWAAVTVIVSKTEPVEL